MYVLRSTLVYDSPRYGKRVTVPAGFGSNGADWAVDVYSDSWWVHDWLCIQARWDDGSPVSNWQASSVLADILQSEGRWFRARYWWLATWLFGCGNCRKNGQWPWSAR